MQINCIYSGFAKFVFLRRTPNLELDFYMKSKILYHFFQFQWLFYGNKD